MDITERLKNLSSFARLTCPSWITAPIALLTDSAPASLASWLVLNLVKYDSAPGLLHFLL